MIRYWVRELFGWLFVLMGLGLFYICLAMLMAPQPRILEAPALSVIGIIVFRGGIHLLKVAVAARVAMATQSEPSKPVVPEKRKAANPTPWDW